MKTNWTKPGEGATLQRLQRALLEAPTAEQLEAAHKRLARLSQGDWTRRTNLKLDGRALTAYDVERIANIEV